MRNTCKLVGTDRDLKNSPNLSESVDTVLISADLRIKLEKEFRNNLENIWLIISRVGRRPRTIFS